MTGIGERINARRKELGMTQEELSKKLGYKNKSTISQIENGVNDIMQSKVASFAAAALPETVTRGRRTAAG